MTDGSIVIALVIAVAVIAALIAKLASFLSAFTEETHYLCREMDRADSYEEYRRWRGELRCHYLMLIPFVNHKNVMRLYNRIFHRADRAKQDKRKDSLVPLLMPSVLGICLCLVCLCGMSWAWFTASVEAPKQQMTAANYSVTVETVIGNGEPIEPESNDSYTLVAGIPYMITLRASGSAQASGYCLIACNDTKYYTEPFRSGQVITLALTPTESGIYTFTGVWGYPVDDVVIIPETTENSDDNTPDDPSPTSAVDDPTQPLAPTTVPAPAASSEPTVGEPIVDQPIVDQLILEGVYTVQPGDTLSGIAEKCNTTTENLAAYNNITDPSRITAGQILNVPPEDYIIPEPEPSSPLETTPAENLPAPSDATVTEPITEPETESATDGE